MPFINNTPYPAQQYDLESDDGEPLSLVVMRLSYDLRPEPHSLVTHWPVISAVQTPLAQGDVHYGNPKKTSVKFPGDLSSPKPMCDVILFNARAYPWHCRPDAPLLEIWRRLICGYWPTRFLAGIYVGTTPTYRPFTGRNRQDWLDNIDHDRANPIPKYQATFPGKRLFIKAVRVVGERKRLLSPHFWRDATTTKPGWSQPTDLIYENAFGGTTLNKSYDKNPVGKGWYGFNEKERPESIPAPTIEKMGVFWGFFNRVLRGMDYEPAGFGAIPADWTQRAKYAGLAEYHQAAPVDQWMPYPQGGEEVMLQGMVPPTERGRQLVHFLLPWHKAHLNVKLANGRTQTIPMVIDTVLIDPEHLRLELVHRGVVPSAINLEVDEVEVVFEQIAPKIQTTQRRLSKADYERARKR